MEKLNGTSMDLVQENVKKLKEIFPEIFIEGKIDFDLLRQICNGGGVQNTESSKERYSLTWNGKSRARQIAQEVSTGTLRPAKEESKNWDSTENIYIEGDNLEVLKLLQKSYHGKIKMIYIDPPYNTGKDFVYKDNFTDNIENYKKVTGQINEEGTKLTTNTDSDGRYHSNWLNMMYPRLKLARNLLTDDGVIFISIDDNEQANLKKICDEIFGEENFIGTIIYDKGNAQNDAINLQKNHEYILVYSKILDNLLSEKVIIKKEVFLERDKYYYLGAGITTGGEGGTLNKRPNLGYTIYYNEETDDKIALSDYDIEKAKMLNDEDVVYLDNKELIEKNYIKIRPPKKGILLGCWTWSLDKFKSEKDKIKIEKIQNGYTVRKKEFIISENIFDEKGKKFTYESKNINIKSIWNFSSSEGTKELNKLFQAKVFENSKNKELIKKLLLIITKSDEIILDFFSGSATTAHSVMQLNAEDGGNRKYIMVQLPELCDESSEAYKAGYKNICEIGKERIRRAGEKIKSDESLPLENREKLDIGFKVFKLDSSNIKEWDTNTEDLQQTLLDSMENIKSDRSLLDVLYEILLKYGLDLNIPIEENKDFYSIGGGSLLISLNKEINDEVINSICEECKNLLEIDKDFKTTVILRDNSFKNDVDKTNAIKKLEQVGINEIRSI